MLKPYPKYKETPALWLNSIPNHWESHKIRELFIERSIKVSDKDYPPLSVSKAGVVPQIATVAKTNDGDNRKLVKKGDFAINSRSDRRGSSGISNYDGSVSLINIVLKPRSFVNGRYMHYLLKSHYFIEEFYRNGRGIVADLWTTRYTEMKSIYLPVPSIEEQDQIVSFLDWKLAKINKLIQAKKKQIALLNEQKQVIIHNAVTKGVDPNVPMKDSGIEWIGQIPQEWVVNRLKTQISLSTSKKNRDNEFYVGMENIQSWTGKYVSTTEIDSEGICNIFENNNILFGKLRPYLAKVYLTENNGVCSSEFLVLKNFNGILRYMFYILLSYKFIDLVNSSTYGAKMPRANWSFIGNCNIPIPSLEDQNRIASYLDEKCYKIENLKGKIQNEIDLLYEYRTRLISDVVTGKVDVRDIEIPEYEGYSDETINGEIDDNIVLEEEGGEMEVE
ncbi:restriction endonuclease subunit S [uncultured Enterococcus sp.]|uniref:restriction endonuclease subunit S n=1 Tax=uncultured Enterococcus sp. TaxID=167972 RepID=UPI0026199609|nr:restriction endonuclease subunit S [uncultured Enterococcus sp.]